MMKRIVLIAGMTLVFAGFQNCAKTTFSNSSGSDLSTKGSLQPIPLDASDMASDGSASGQISQPAAPPAPSPAPMADDKKNDDKKNVSYESDDSENESPDYDDDLVACILVDHGKSLKLGYVADKLEGVNAVSQSVCITRHACLDIVSKAFAVEGAYERGYCEHNPNVLRFKDADVEAMIKKLMP